ncbi:bifunctional MaoC family dehydratase N-terminal/OB-fold nucleic acid binding domain-containing protein [Sphaerisporangium sp. TRM90804]|uniref:bifunctional MaoC family dehydratase N-terminal/OB-fold nucleic acid binding domain-containing protein n=1 Tax=Sphaerisporangium sp. TRM90804 TaxID=3031113 RepID=UPI002446E5A0|nr:bifunctional MaoC family dehydratase N-terminal/OB-fold nucleic acid binding domain-containing protein [Sphaerisporangium sp. TRM90804]MDH2427698.1 bifunctional MaoC family dehydratase N-terminal/OB-fold nucleic acid binding domain-containing protein [Sphaerisporangium sp. TRM90804]
MTTTAESGVHQRLADLAERQIAAGEVRGAPAADPVNLPMIRHWAAAMGDANPVYTDEEFAAGSAHGAIVAPPAMIQVWTMAGLDGGDTVGPVAVMLAALDESGFTGVVATNCEQTYHRYLRLGERPVAATRMSGLSGPKTTALGVGYFVTWVVTWYSDDEPVAEMMFRVLKFRPVERNPEPAKHDPYPLAPAVNRDTAFFWEGARQGELRIQKCGDCGEPRHPPGPVCPTCRSLNRTYTLAAGVGEVYSYVVHHNPPVPGREIPFVVAVIALPEGVRIVGNIVECAAEKVGIGMPVRVVYREMDDELILPMWIPRES